MKRLIGGVFCTVFVCTGAFAAGQQQGAVAVKTAKATTVEETEPYVAVGRTVGSQEVKLTARVVGTLWERNGEEGQSVKKGELEKGGKNT